jgi:hypothetical protein
VEQLPHIQGVYTPIFKIRYRTIEYNINKYYITVISVAEILYSAAEITMIRIIRITIVVYYIMASITFWYVDSLYMAEFRRNM